MTPEIKNYGFVKPTVDETHYQVLGGLLLSPLPDIIIQPDHNWRSFVSVFERQFGEGWDTYGCTVFGTLHCLATMLKQKYGKDYDFAERFIYNLAEVMPPGADPHLIAETIRKNGVVEQKELPMTDSLEKFASPRPMTQELIDKGHSWLKKFGFKHEWVYTEKDNLSLDKRQQLIREHLKYSPLGASVTAWKKNEKGEYISDGKPNTHWVEITDIEDDGKIWVNDTYAPCQKLLSADHDIGFVKRYFLECLPGPVERPAGKSRWQEFWEMVMQILEAVFSKKTI
jgi:hypothetical protein